jgi:chorismate dehydratase
LGFDNIFHRTNLNLPEALDMFEGLLLIGDAAMRESLKQRRWYCCDLGELWYRYTGLPFVYALWIVNRASVSGREENVRELGRALIRAKIRSQQDLEQYVEGSGMEWYGTDDLLSYWKIISYNLDEPERKGLETFYRLAAEIGVIERFPDLCYMPGSDLI